MLTVFIKAHCAYSAMVLAKLAELAIPYDERDIADEMNRRELILIGGAERVPFMVDGETQLYESEDIVAYLDAKYGPQSEVV